jgi:hypothetical protein
MVAILAVAISMFLLTPCAGGELTNRLEYGSVEAVTAYAIPLVDTTGLAVYQIQTNGDVLYFANIGVNKTAHFNSKQELDQWFQNGLQKGLQNILTSPEGDRTRTYKVFAVVFNWDMLYTLFEYYKEFNLVCMNGQYSTPDFSQAKMELGIKIPYRVPKIKFAILEVSDTIGLVDIIDSRNDPNPWTGGVDESEELLILRTAYITGNYGVKLVVASCDNGEDYRIYNSTGTQVAETPVVLNSPQIAHGTNTVRASGGDPGRHLMLQSSIDLVSWTDVAEHVVYYTGFDGGFSYSEPVLSSPRKFFRAKRVASPN